MLFSIPGLPPSTNQSLAVFRGRLIHTAEARNFRNNAELNFDKQLKDQSLDQILAMENKCLLCSIYFYSNWKTKKGTIRKVDVANKEKLLLDSLISVMNKNNFHVDDSQIFHLSLHKIQSDIEKTEINIMLKENE